MKNTWTIMSKEFARFFGDRRMILMTVLPALLIYVAYTFMGTMMASVFEPDEDHAPQIYVTNAPDSIKQIAQSVGIGINHAQTQETETIKEKINLKEADLLMIFPPDFDALVEEYDVQTATTPAPNIEIYYNSTEPNSHETYYTVIMILDQYEASLARLWSRGAIGTFSGCSINLFMLHLPLRRFVRRGRRRCLRVFFRRSGFLACHWLSFFRRLLFPLCHIVFLQD